MTSYGIPIYLADACGFTKKYCVMCCIIISWSYRGVHKTQIEVCNAPKKIQMSIESRSVTFCFRSQFEFSVMIRTERTCFYRTHCRSEICNLLVLQTNSGIVGANYKASADSSAWKQRVPSQSVGLVSAFQVTDPAHKGKRRAWPDVLTVPPYGKVCAGTPKSGTCVSQSH